MQIDRILLATFIYSVGIELIDTLILISTGSRYWLLLSVANNVYSYKTGPKESKCDNPEVCSGHGYKTFYVKNTARWNIF